MKQILQSLKTGETRIEDIPTPKTASGHVLVATDVSLVSAGTERMLVEFGKASWLQKAKQQPDKVKMVLDKVRADGLAAAVEAVRSKLDQPLALGYCNVGTVVAKGDDVSAFSIGDRVVSNGKHAEVVSIPKNLCARIPDGVSNEQASFTVLAAIGLQGIRLANLTLGECVVVTGLGLIGLLTVQLLRAHGCRVLGIDFDDQRLELARKFGAEVVNPRAGDDVHSAALSFSRGRGVDAVLITASSTSSEPVSQAAQICRKRGRIVLIGVAGLELSRADFYEKELSFQVSCSYGPGRYDPSYEDRGNDYPIAFVRWTEQRNFEAVLDLMSQGEIDVSPLISHRFVLEEATAAYSLLSSKESSLGILLNYATSKKSPSGEWLTKSSVNLQHNAKESTGQGVAFLGAGNYAGRVLIPAFKAARANLHSIVSGGGVSAVHFGKKYGFVHASTDTRSVLENPDVGTVIIATRHDAHAAQVLAALRAGKNVFCEKPLCLTFEELREIESAAKDRPSQLLMIGFNRRFAPLVIQAKNLLGSVSEPKIFIMTVNAGAIPSDHWTQDKSVGGGRIIGEGCHFIDLLRHLAGAEIIDAKVMAIGRHPTLSTIEDKVTISLRFADGSVGTVHYLANGDKSFPKERLEIFCAGRILQLDNFRRLTGWGWKGFKRKSLWRQDKGQGACASAFMKAVLSGGSAPIPLTEVIEVSRVTIEVAAQAENS